MPAGVNAGTEVNVEITVSKAQLSGFGRLSIELPEGITIKESKADSAEYSSESGFGTWAWASLPASEKIAVNLTLIVGAGVSGEKELKAKFSYVEDNNKQFVDMEPAKFTVNPLVPPAPETKDTTQKISNAEPPGDIKVVRTISLAENKKDYLVEVMIRKDGTKGFARYSDDVHDNVIAKPVKTDGGSFSIADGKIKFVWVSVPDKSELNVSYILSSKNNKTIILNGEYSYLEDSQSKKLELRADTLVFGPAPVAKKETKDDKPETGHPDKQPEKETAGEPLEKKDCKADFVVQVGAFTNTAVNASVLARKFSINENIRTESQDGMSKFLVGKHKEYKKARNHRETVKNVNGVKSAFVVAYNGGSRITVQEALMMCNQRWFK